MSLFRNEAIEANKNKLHGDVFLISPLSFSVITYLIVFLVVFILVMVFSGSYSRIEQVPGYLVPKAGLVKIRVKQAGTLSAIHVEEGQLVKKNDLLVSIESSQIDKNGLSTKEKTLTIMAQERANLVNQMVLLKGQLTSELEQIKNQEETVRFNISSLISQVALQKTLKESAEKTFKDIQGLLAKGFISSSEVEQRQQNSLVQQTRLKLKEQELNGEKFKLKQLTVERQQKQESKEVQISRIKNQVLAFNRSETELIDKGSYTISAPIDGRIGLIYSDSIGASLLNQQAILALLPADEKGSSLVAEMFVPSRAMGFIKPEQDVKILYEAFPFERFGAFSAKIIKVKKTIISPEDNLSPFKIDYPFYTVIAELENTTLSIGGNPVALQPGMAFQANIIQEKRSIIEWIVEPFMGLRGR